MKLLTDNESIREGRMAMEKPRGEMDKVRKSRGTDGRGRAPREGRR